MDVSRVFNYREDLYKHLSSNPQGLFIIATLERYDNVSNLPEMAYGDIRLLPPTQDLDKFESCKEYQDNVVANVKAGRGLFINGTPGNGKTTWTYKIAREYMEQLSLKGSKAIRPVYYANVPELLNDIKRGFKDEDLAKSIETKMRESDLVIFDDIGAENSTEWVKEQLYQYINYRYSNNLACLYTSNLALNQLEQRIADRINGSCKVITFTAVSKRQQI